MIPTPLTGLKKNRGKSAIFFNTNPKHHFNLKSDAKNLGNPARRLPTKNYI
jgi:hypothetical protein